MFRFRPRSNPDVNQYWMCDEGRLWYKELQKESRILRPLARENDAFAPLSWDQAVGRVVDRISRTKEQHGAKAIAGIVGAKATNEEAFLFSRLLQEQVGTTNVAGFSWSPADAFHDDFLIKADKNPNTRGLKALGLLNGGPTADDVLNAAEKGEVKALLVFAADLSAAFAPDKLDKALGNVEVIVCDTDYNGTAEYADVLLPIGTAAETDGTYTNHAGRVQRARQAFPPPGEVKTGWEVLATLRGRLGGTEPVSITEVFGELAQKVTPFAGLTYGKLGSQGMALAS